jgi:hypothetical protein
VTDAHTVESDVTRLVATVDSCLKGYYPRVYGSEYEGTLHGPPSAPGLSRFLQEEGSQFPASYITFLKHHNGWSGYLSGFTLIGVDGAHTIEARRDIDETIEIIADTWSGERGRQVAEQLVDQPPECPEEGPEVSRMIPFGTDFNGALLLFDTRTRRSDGEMEVLLYDTSGPSKRFSGFIEMLEKDSEEVCQEGKEPDER